MAIIFITHASYDWLLPDFDSKQMTDHSAFACFTCIPSKDRRLIKTPVTPVIIPERDLIRFHIPFVRNNSSKILFANFDPK